MLVCILLILGTWNGVLGSSEICELLAHKACNSETLPSIKPETEEEIANGCAKFQTVYQCITNDLKTCHAEYEEIGSEDSHWLLIRGIKLHVLAQICSLNPDTYSKFLSSRDCATKVSEIESKEWSCEKAERKVISALQLRKERLLKSENATVIDLYDDCLSQLFQKNCFIDLQYKECGSDARDVVFQMSKNFVDWDQVCPLDIRIDVLELLDDLSSLTRKDIYVKDYLITDTLF